MNQLLRLVTVRPSRLVVHLVEVDFLPLRLCDHLFALHPPPRRLFPPFCRILTLPGLHLHLMLAMLAASWVLRGHSRWFGTTGLPSRGAMWSRETGNFFAIVLGTQLTWLLDEAGLIKSSRIHTYSLEVIQTRPPGGQSGSRSAQLHLYSSKLILEIQLMCTKKQF